MDPATIAMLASLGVDVGKMLFDAFNKPKGSPGEAANPYLEEAKRLYDPYRQQGQDAYGKLNPQYSQMTENPGDYLENILKGYEPSRAYELRKEEALKAAGNTAAAGGMRGSPLDMKNQAQLTDMLLGEDMQQWLQNVMGIQGRGMSGLDNFYNKGFDATSDVGNILGSQANLGVLNEMFRNMSSKQQSNDIFGGLSSMIGKVGGMFGGAGGSGGSSSPFSADTMRSGYHL